MTIDAKAVALTIAGSDPSGGAGLQADLKTFQQLGVYGMSVVTLITVQNTRGVLTVEPLPASLVMAQLDAVMQDIPPRVIKLGALGNAKLVRQVGERLKSESVPLIIDPVLVSKHGHLLATDDVVDAYQQYLLPWATLVTPNRFEAERLTGCDLATKEGPIEAIEALRTMGVKNSLIKMGDLEDQSWHVFGGISDCQSIFTERIASNNTHGTGCILSAVIAAKLALGESLESAVQTGIERVLKAIHFNSKLGGGIHPAEIRAL